MLLCSSMRILILSNRNKPLIFCIANETVKELFYNFTKYLVSLTDTKFKNI
jgi:hypothetical protein